MVVVWRTNRSSGIDEAGGEEEEEEEEGEEEEVEEEEVEEEVTVAVEVTLVDDVTAGSCEPEDKKEVEPVGQEEPDEKDKNKVESV